MKEEVSQGKRGNTGFCLCCHVHEADEQNPYPMFPLGLTHDKTSHCRFGPFQAPALALLLTSTRSSIHTHDTRDTCDTRGVPSRVLQPQHEMVSNGLVMGGSAATSGAGSVVLA